MNFQQISDVVKWSADFHAELGSAYTRMVEVAAVPRVREVLRYLATHEQEIERGLRGHLQQTEPGLLGGWVRGAPSYDKLQSLQKLRSRMDAETVDGVTSQAVDIHKALQDMYQELAGYAELPESRELLKNLRDHEEAETRRMVRDIGWYEST